MAKKTTAKTQNRSRSNGGGGGTPRGDAPDVEVIGIGDVIADPANVRTHDDRNKRTIAGSLKLFGAGRSIVLDNRRVVRAGNGTVEQAAENGFTELVVVKPKPGQLVAVQRDEWTPAEATAYAIADNRSAELAAWYAPNMGPVFAGLDGAFSLDQLGFTDTEWQAFLARPADDGPGPAEFDQVDETIAVEYCCPRCDYKWSGKPS